MSETATEYAYPVSKACTRLLHGVAMYTYDFRCVNPATEYSQKIGWGTDINEAIKTISDPAHLGLYLGVFSTDNAVRTALLQPEYEQEIRIRLMTAASIEAAMRTQERLLDNPTGRMEIDRVNWQTKGVIIQALHTFTQGIYQSASMHLSSSPSPESY